MTSSDVFSRGIIVQTVNSLAAELAARNLQEVRRKAMTAWRAVPDSQLDWKPDDSAMTFKEVMRHIWHVQVWYHEVIKNRRSLGETYIFESIPIGSVEEEITLSLPYHEEFVSFVRNLSDSELLAPWRNDVPTTLSTGDMLSRFAYHEGFHTGQLLQYLRQIGQPRPNIWNQ